MTAAALPPRPGAANGGGSGAADTAAPAPRLSCLCWFAHPLGIKRWNLMKGPRQWCEMHRKETEEWDA